jgi:hypothetical protein
MRVASICDTCATYINADCIIYNGEYLPNIDVSPLDSLEEILVAIDEAIETPVGSGAPIVVPDYVGQLYYDSTNSVLYIGLSDTLPNWGNLGSVVTTTTTSSTTSTTTTV